MTALALAVFGAGVVGSLHCAAMCGGIVGVYAADPAPRAGWRRGGEHCAYNGGRLVAYVLLGAAGGALGASADVAAHLAGVGRLAATVAGGCIALWGSLALLEALGVRAHRARAPRWLRALGGRAFALVARRDLVARAAVLGLVTGLMPCGWLYAFVLAAAGTASPLAGAGLMLAFWAGTVPLMAALGVGLRAVAWPLRRHLPAVSAVAMIAVGLITVSGRVAPPPVTSVPAHVEQADARR